MIFTIAAQDLRALFASPLAWLVLTVVQVILGYGFLKRLDDFLQIQSQLAQLASPPGVTELVAAPTYATAAAVLLFAIPLLAMRMIAEERRNQTMTLLLSAPISMTEIILGKFVGLMAFLLLIILLVVAMPLMLSTGTRLDMGLLATLTLALILLAASFAAVSLYASSLTAQPMAAALLSFGLLLAIKSYHWVAEDRVSSMAQTPNINWKFHLRMSLTLGTLALIDACLIAVAGHSLATYGPSMQLLFGFEVKEEKKEKKEKLENI
jgi:ABC-2 type transport system permease protein